MYENECVLLLKGMLGSLVPFGLGGLEPAGGSVIW